MPSRMHFMEHKRRKAGWKYDAKSGTRLKTDTYVELSGTRDQKYTVRRNPEYVRCLFQEVSPR